MSERPIFAIFEGGGAKGVAHVGAVAAAERDFFFVGVAGASAGAIVAALLAVGFTASDLLDPKKVEENILSRHGKTPVDLLGRQDWERLKEHEENVAAVFAAKGWTARVKKGWAARGAVGDLFKRWPEKGVLSTDHVREFLNMVLRGKLDAIRKANGLTDPTPDRITFRDLDFTADALKGDILPLKIIGTNVSTGELWVFDRELTPQIEVAQAVAASIAIPGAFRPVEIKIKDKTHRFVDGGVVSNLPIWVFANEKLAFERANRLGPPVPIVGFTLGDKVAVKASPKGDGTLRHLRDVLQTSLSGGQAVSQRFVQDLTVADLRTDLTLLDFDASEERMLKAFHDGFGCADRELRHALIDRPRLIKSQLARIHTLARTGILTFIPKGERRRPWKLRVALVEKAQDSETYRVTHGFNMEDDADDRLALDERGRGAPAAYKERIPKLTPVGPEWADPDKDFMTKYERALLPQAVRSIISIPIFASVEDWDNDPDERSTPCGVVSIDCSRSLETAFDDVDFMSLLTAQSTLLFPVVTREPKRG